MSEQDRPQRQVLRTHGRTHLPGGSDPIPGSGGSGIQFDIDNVGDWLLVETTDFVANSFSEPASVTFGDDATNYGMAFNAAKGTLFTADPGLNGPGAPTIGVVNVEAGGTGTDGQLGMHVLADTSSGTGSAIAMRLEADGSTQYVGGLTIGASSSSGKCQGVNAQVGTHGGDGEAVVGFATVTGGSANAVGVRGIANVNGGGSGLALLFEGLDHANNPIFQVRVDGSVHVKTGASTAMVADL